MAPQKATKNCWSSSGHSRPDFLADPESMLRGPFSTLGKGSTKSRTIATVPDYLYKNCPGCGGPPQHVFERVGLPTQRGPAAWRVGNLQSSSDAGARMFLGQWMHASGRPARANEHACLQASSLWATPGTEPLGYTCLSVLDPQSFGLIRNSKWGGTKHVSFSHNVFLPPPSETPTSKAPQGARASQAKHQRYRATEGGYAARRPDATRFSARRSRENDAKARGPAIRRTYNE